MAQLTFRYTRQARIDREKLQTSVDWYLAALVKHGQIVDQYVTGWERRCFVAYVKLVRRDSLAEKHHSSYGQRDLNDVSQSFGALPVVKIIAQCQGKSLSTWRKSQSLFLFACKMREYGAVFCGDTGICIPGYTLPLSDDDHERVYFWWKECIAHDCLWFYSGKLEIPAYKQLADPNSQLSSSGRELSAKIEAATQRPTFYCLKRYWGRSQGEAERLCPGCGRQWHVIRDPHRKGEFHEFAFRCEPCRLVSYLADSYDDERHARIGEFRGVNRFVSKTPRHG